MVTQEEFDAFPPEVQERIERSRLVSEEMRALRAAAREQKRLDVESLQSGKWKLRYTKVGGQGLALATKWDHVSGAYLAIFTVRSRRDQFSRPDARRALVEHILAGTHRLAGVVTPVSTGKMVKVGMVDQGRFNRDLKDRCRKLNSYLEDATIGASLFERMQTHPHEFPSKFRKAFLTAAHTSK